MNTEKNVSKNNIAAKLLQVMEACGYVQKNAENKEQKYKYVSAAAVMEKVNQALTKIRLVSIPEFSVLSEKDKPTSRGALWQLVTVQLRLQIIDPDSGESITVTSLGSGTDPGDKAVAKAQTMAMKYAWLTALNIETGDDPEGDGGTDRELFGQPGQAPVYSQPGQPGQQFNNPGMTQPRLVLPPGFPNSPKVYGIGHLWQKIGWDVNMLPGYLSQRFQKPSDQVTEAELLVIENEALDYSKQKR